MTVHARPGSSREPVRASASTYAHSMGRMFLWTVPVTLLGFVVALFLRQVTLRDSARMASTDLDGAFGAPVDGVRVPLERQISALLRNAGRMPYAGVLHDGRQNLRAQAKTGTSPSCPRMKLRSNPARGC
ncbi:hypothetical protein [Streptomyces sp. 2A115]|uniref:hypothetical protein n=1 Tax=Streptomyces sp. 2A115 TaxID=3457439 RepID=UPI003FD3FDDD